LGCGNRNDGTLPVSELLMGRHGVNAERHNPSGRIGECQFYLLEAGYLGRTAPRLILGATRWMTSGVALIGTDTTEETR